MPTKVEAVTGFDHNGRRRRGEKFSVSDQTAKDLQVKGLVRVLNGHPKKAAGKRSSASPAARASTQKTSGSSKRGGKQAAPPEKPPEGPAGELATPPPNDAAS